MKSLFRRASSGAASSGLGTTLVCVPAPSGAAVPAGCAGVVFDARGQIRRVAPGQRVQCAKGEQARIFHPGPYAFDVAPYAAAPEAGLRVELAVDSPDPRFTQQRFDLFLASEAPEALGVAMLQSAVEAALQRELAQDKLFLPPCTMLDEWNAFRQGVDELVYTRFGMMVDDCVPVDLGGQVDYASMLAARAVQPVVQPVALEWAARTAQALRGPHDPDRAAADAQAMRRLFLELPCVSAGLRLALAQAKVPFAAQKALLARLDGASLAVDTMPSFALSAPSVPLGAARLAGRAAASLEALEALDEAWALLASLRAAVPADLDAAERIVANLEAALAARWSATVDALEEA